MAEITLKQFAEGKSKADVGRALKVSRAAISQMFSEGREIYVEVDDEGVVATDDEGKPKVWEKRPIPARKAKAAAA